MNLLGIAGSLRDGSYNRQLLEAAARSAPADMQVRVYRDLGAIPLFNEISHKRSVVARNPSSSCAAP
jgi:chromate reductase